MASALSDLKTLIQPTREPLQECDWADIERRLGLRLPLDYKLLVEAYGPGSFDRFIWVLQPSGTNPNLDLSLQRGVQLTALRELLAAGEELPFGVEIGDEELAPWAITDNGDVCHWLLSASDDPDDWVVTVNEARGPRWTTFNLSASEFLVAVLSGDLPVDQFPDDFPSDSPAFEAVTT